MATQEEYDIELSNRARTFPIGSLVRVFGARGIVVGYSDNDGKPIAENNNETLAFYVRVDYNYEHTRIIVNEYRKTHSQYISDIVQEAFKTLAIATVDNTDPYDIDR